MDESRLIAAVGAYLKALLSCGAISPQLTLIPHLLASALAPVRCATECLLRNVMRALWLCANWHGR